MAKNRFPGRPGDRFNRYDENYDIAMSLSTYDPTIPVVDSLRRGLDTFRAAFGESDEDEEFEGFTQEDVSEIEERLDAKLSLELSYRDAADRHDDANSDVATSRLSSDVDLLESTSASERTRSRDNPNLKKSYRDLIKAGLWHRRDHSHFDDENTSPPDLTSKRTLMKIRLKLPNKKREEESQSGSCFVPRKIRSNFLLGAQNSLDVRSPAKSALGPLKCDVKSSAENEMDDFVKEKSPKKDVTMDFSKRNVGSSGSGKSVAEKVTRVDASPSESSLSGISKGSKYTYQFIQPEAMKDRKKAESLAKFLMQKSKELAKCNASKTKKSFPAFVPKSIKKSFLLPTKSRFSRVIIPNKRLATDHSQRIPPPKRQKFNTVSNASYISSTPTEKPAPVIRKNSSNQDLLRKSVGLFDQPLVVRGKRQWKPSLKVRMKYISESDIDNQTSKSPSVSVKSPTSSSGQAKGSVKSVLPVSKLSLPKRAKEFKGERTYDVSPVRNSQPKFKATKMASDKVKHERMESPDFSSSHKYARKGSVESTLCATNLKATCVICGHKIPELCHFATTNNSGQFFAQGYPMCPGCQSFYRGYLRLFLEEKLPPCKWDENCAVIRGKMKSRDFCRPCRFDRCLLYLDLQPLYRDRSANDPDILRFRERKNYATVLFRSRLDSGQLNPVTKNMLQNILVEAWHWRIEWDLMAPDLQASSPSEQRVCAVCYWVKHYKSKYMHVFEEKHVCRRCYEFFEEISKNPTAEVCCAAGDCHVSFLEPNGCRSCHFDQCLRVFDGLIDEHQLTEKTVECNARRRADVRSRPPLPLIDLPPTKKMHSINRVKMTRESDNIQTRVHLSSEEKDVPQKFSASSHPQNADDLSSARRSKSPRRVIDPKKPSTPQPQMATLKKAMVSTSSDQQVLPPSSSSPLPPKVEVDHSSDGEIVDRDGANDVDRDNEDSTSSKEAGDDDVSKQQRQGPRIKHVCRNASLVVGRPRATFSDESQLRLSALPNPIKQAIIKCAELKKADDSSDDDLPLEEIIRNAENKRDDIVIVKKSPQKSPQQCAPSKTSAKTSTKAPPFRKLYRKYPIHRRRHIGHKRKIRCRKCTGCQSKPCQTCVYCLDRPNLGGPGKLKQACIKRTCQFPHYSWNLPKESLQKRKRDGNADSNANSDTDSTISRLSTPTSEILRDSPKSRQGEKAMKTTSGQLGTTKRSGSIQKLGDRSARDKKNEVRVPSSAPQQLLSPTNTEIPHEQVSRRLHKIKGDFRPSMEVTASRGFSVITSAPVSVRTLCFVCGSAGKQEMLFCSVCCEPYHPFCVDADERPDEADAHSWICKKCQSCAVCGRLSNLLRCDKCRDMYHAECLGPNYPTKRSKKNIWICTRCVKCKSCGATTPGDRSNARWMHDFSLCHNCGCLMDQGNYCPLCLKCYSDDDWDCQMIQCSQCERWVHSRCESLTDEMYQQLSVMPEDFEYVCGSCSGLKREEAPWWRALQTEMSKNFNVVLNTLLSAKCARQLVNITDNGIFPHDDAMGDEPAANETMETSRTVLATENSQSLCSQRQNTEQDTSTSGEDHREIIPELREPGTSLTINVEKHKYSFSDSQCHSATKLTEEHSRVGTSRLKAVTVEDISRYGEKAVVTTTAPEIAVVTSSAPEKVGKMCCTPERACVRSCVSEKAPIPSSAPEKAVVASYAVKKQPFQNCAQVDDLEILCGPNGDACSVWKDGKGFCEVNQIGANHGKTLQQCSVLEREDCAHAVDDGCIAEVKCLMIEILSNVEEYAGDAVIVGGLTERVAVERDDEPGVGCSASGDCKADSEKGVESDIRTEVIVIDSDCDDEGSDICDKSDKTKSCDGEDQTVSCNGSERRIPCDDSDGNFENVMEYDVSTVDESLLSDTGGCHNHKAVSYSISDVDGLITQKVDSEKCVLNNSYNCDTTKCDNGFSSANCVKENCNISQSLQDDGLFQNVNKDKFYSRCSGVPNFGVSDDRGGRESTGKTAMEVESRITRDCHDGSHCEGTNQEVAPTVEVRVTRSHAANSQKSDASRYICEDVSTSGNDNGDVLNSLSCFVRKTVDHLCNDNITRDFSNSSSVEATDWDRERMKRSAVLMEIAAKQSDYVPPDIQSVKYKLDIVGYHTVDQFSKDLVQIIDKALANEEYQSATVKKAIASIRSVFTKQMERCFPWFHLNKSTLWRNSLSLPAGMLPNAVLPPSNDHTYAQWLTRPDVPVIAQPSQYKVVPPQCENKPVEPSVGLGQHNKGEVPMRHAGPDSRQCGLCWKYGDDDPEDAGRLLYAGNDDWVHVNCAVWSAEVYEDADGSLQRLFTALSRARTLRCDHCGKTGATVGCNTRGCPSNYHFMCARADNCAFQEDKRIYCRQHIDRVHTNLIETFAVNRRVSIDMEGIKITKKGREGLDPATVNVLFGSCTVECLGILTSNSDCYDYLLPLNFRCTRVYWSTEDARRRCVYTCQVIEVKPFTSDDASDSTVADVTFAHDPTHPQYVPINQIKLPSFRSPMKSAGYMQDYIQCTDSKKTSDGLDSGLLGASDKSQRNDVAEITSSQCRVSGFDLRGLSANTVKQLNLDYTKAVGVGSASQVVKRSFENSDVYDLVKVVGRLNEAASKCKKRSLSAWTTERPLPMQEDLANSASCMKGFVNDVRNDVGCDFMSEASGKGRGNVTGATTVAKNSGASQKIMDTSLKDSINHDDLSLGNVEESCQRVCQRGVSGLTTSKTKESSDVLRSSASLGDETIPHSVHKLNVDQTSVESGGKTSPDVDNVVEYSDRTTLESISSAITEDQCEGQDRSKFQSDEPFVPGNRRSIGDACESVTSSGGSVNSNGSQGGLLIIDESKWKPVNADVKDFSSQSDRKDLEKCVVDVKRSTSPNSFNDLREAPREISSDIRIDSRRLAPVVQVTEKLETGQERWNIEGNIDCDCVEQCDPVPSLKVEKITTLVQPRHYLDAIMPELESEPPMLTCDGEFIATQKCDKIVQRTTETGNQFDPPVLVSSVKPKRNVRGPQRYEDAAVTMKNPRRSFTKSISPTVPKDSTPTVVCRKVSQSNDLLPPLPLKATSTLANGHDDVSHRNQKLTLSLSKQTSNTKTRQEDFLPKKVSQETREILKGGIGDRSQSTSQPDEVPVYSKSGLLIGHRLFPNRIRTYNMKPLSVDVSEANYSKENKDDRLDVTVCRDEKIKEKTFISPSDDAISEDIGDDKSSLKTYTLRKTAGRRSDEVSRLRTSQSSPGKSVDNCDERTGKMSFDEDKLICSPKGAKNESDNHGFVEKYPLCSEIDLKIKEKSIARSSPDKSGPFKCLKCKRSYRTRESYVSHDAQCDFVISSSSDDSADDWGDDADSDRDWVPTGCKKRRVGSLKSIIRTRHMSSQETFGVGEDLGHDVVNEEDLGHDVANGEDMGHDVANGDLGHDVANGDHGKDDDRTGGAVCGGDRGCVDDDGEVDNGFKKTLRTEECMADDNDDEANKDNRVAILRNDCGNDDETNLGASKNSRISWSGTDQKCGYDETSVGLSKNSGGVKGCGTDQGCGTDDESNEGASKNPEGKECGTNEQSNEGASKNLGDKECGTDRGCGSEDVIVESVSKSKISDNNESTLISNSLPIIGNTSTQDNTNKNDDDIRGVQEYVDNGHNSNNNNEISLTNYEDSLRNSNLSHSQSVGNQNGQTVSPSDILPNDINVYPVKRKPGRPRKGEKIVHTSTKKFIPLMAETRGIKRRSLEVVSPDKGKTANSRCINTMEVSSKGQPEVRHAAIGHGFKCDESPRSDGGRDKDEVGGKDAIVFPVSVVDYDGQSSSMQQAQNNSAEVPMTKQKHIYFSKIARLNDSQDFSRTSSGSEILGNRISVIDRHCKGNLPNLDYILQTRTTESIHSKQTEIIQNVATTSPKRLLTTLKNLQRQVPPVHVIPPQNSVSNVGTETPIGHIINMQHSIYQPIGGDGIVGLTGSASDTLVSYAQQRSRINDKLTPLEESELSLPPIRKRRLSLDESQQNLVIPHDPTNILAPINYTRDSILVPQTSNILGNELLSISRTNQTLQTMTNGATQLIVSQPTISLAKHSSCPQTTRSFTNQIFCVSPSTDVNRNQEQGRQMLSIPSASNHLPHSQGVSYVGSFVIGQPATNLIGSMVHVSESTSISQSNAIQFLHQPIQPRIQLLPQATPESFFPSKTAVKPVMPVRYIPTVSEIKTLRSVMLDHNFTRPASEQPQDSEPSQNNLGDNLDHRTIKINQDSRKTGMAIPLHGEMLKSSNDEAIESLGSGKIPTYNEKADFSSPFSSSSAAGQKSQVPNLASVSKPGVIRENIVASLVKKLVRESKRITKMKPASGLQGGVTKALRGKPGLGRKHAKSSTKQGRFKENDQSTQAGETGRILKKKHLIGRQKKPLTPRNADANTMPSDTTADLAPHSEVRPHRLIHSHRRRPTTPQQKDDQIQRVQKGEKLSSAATPRPKYTDGPRLMFEIKSDDGFCCRATSVDEAWGQVLDRVQDARNACRLPALSYASIDGLSMFGLSHNTVVYLIEQLYGAKCCSQYHFLYHTYDKQEIEEEAIENPTGCARSERYKTHKHCETFSFLLSRYRHPPTYDPSEVNKELINKSARRATSLDLPMAMRFRHLKGHSREAVGVYRSPIDGRGLFCKRDIDDGEMIIEYAGEVIRAVLTDKREKYYESKGIGCYMFRIDGEDVIDATTNGNAARFINHSCEPNCFSRVICIENKKHIVIFASRPIKKGEELTYDYKFPHEEVKILCRCGSRKCRKYLN